MLFNDFIMNIYEYFETDSQFAQHKLK